MGTVVGHKLEEGVLLYVKQVFIRNKKVAVHALFTIKDGCNINLGPHTHTMSFAFSKNISPCISCHLHTYIPVNGFILMAYKQYF